MTIGQALKRAQRDMKIKEATLLLSYVIHKKYTTILAHTDAPISIRSYMRFLHLVRKRKKGVPFAYLTNEKAFFGLDFIVNKHTLIPRPDTEVLIEKVLEELDTKTSPYTLIDVGVGSGCIPIAIQKNVNNALTCIGTDKYKKALRIASKNSIRHNAPIQYIHTNLIKSITHEMIHTKNLIITANLPYIKKEQYKKEPSIKWEPTHALIAKERGLALYKILFTQIQTKKLDTLHCLTIYIEIDPDQKQEIKDIIHMHWPKAKVLVHKDLAQLDRIVQIKIHHP